MKDIIMFIVWGMLGIFAGICIFWSIYAFVKYGNMPITEVPSWALWFMFK